MDGKRTDASEVLLIPKVASNDHLTPFSIQSSSVAISMTNSDINVYSGQKSEQDGDTRNENDKKSRFFRVGRSHGVGSSVGAKFLLNPLLLMRRGSSQMQSQEMPSPSNTDIMESLGEMRPYHDSRDSERSDHYKRLGLQDVRHTTSTDEDIAVNITRQQNDNTTRKNAMSPTAVLDISFDHEVTYDSITAQGSPIDSNIPTLTPAAIARPTSRLGRLGRFKFPSISMGGIQRSKGSGGSNPADTMPDPVQLNIRRGSLSALMVKPFRDVSVRYAAMHFSNSASTIATANTPAMTILGQITPGSDSYSSISSSHNGLDASSSANKKSWQSLSGLSDANAHHPHHSSKAVPSMYMTSNQQPSAVMSNERSFAVVKDAEHHNTIPQNHRSGMNNIFGSERFTSSSSGSHGQVYGPKTSIKSGHGPQHAHGSSRRTVSASQIFPNSISGLDGVDKNTPSASQEGYQSSVCYFQSERGIEQAGSGKEIEPRKTELERAQSEEERSVGRYLFGNELSNMSFGETGTFSKATIVSANMVEKSTNTRAVFKFPAASASMDKLSASTKPGASFPSTAQDSNPASNQLNSETRRKLFHIRLIRNCLGVESADVSSTTVFPRGHYRLRVGFVPQKRYRGEVCADDINKGFIELDFGFVTTPNMCFGSKTNSTASGRNPDIRHLEPRSAVADYTPTIHYKRQRSMSLQDADLLTADQFITLMPDDVSPKRRFSSEETVPENAWYGNSRRKNVPQPDPAATLRSLLSALQVKCGLVIQHLDAVSVSVSVSPAKDVGADIITEAIGTNMATHQKTFQNNSKEVDVAAKPSGGSAVSAQGTEGKPELQYGNQSLNKDNRALVDVVRKGRPPDQARVLENDQNAKERREDTSGRNYKAQDTDIRTDMDAVDSKKDLVESIITLFDEVDYAMNQMVEIMTKCISTEQLSSLSKELDSMCFLAQQVLHVETDGDRMSEGQSVGREESDNCSAAKANAAEGEKELRFSRTSLDQGLTTAGMDTASTPEIIGGTGRLEVGHVKNDSVDQTRLDATQPQHRPQYRQQSQDIKSKGAAGGSGTMQEIQKETVKNYMFVLPASGYKIEGCNDLRKIEHALRQEQPPLKLVSIPIAATGTPERSLLSQASAVRTSRIAAGEEVIAGTSANTDNEETALAASLSTVNFIGHSMDHVKSLPKCKEIGGSTGMAGTISLVCPAGINMAGSSGSIGTATTGPAMTSAPVPGISMLGDYSREHMGHEAYYYRNWFLGKEHRTFVGQVEGLGTVIISIIKDMVVPTEARPSTPGRLAPSSSTMVTSNSASSFVPSEAIYPTVHMRPEIARSTNSFYPGRGQHLGSGGGSLISSSRSSSEAMRVILPASTAVVPGAGRSDYRCILRQKDVDSLRITLPEPEPSPLNNLARRVGKPQWKTILQSIHPAITQQAASKLKKVQTNPHFERELAKFDETMLRFNYKFGVLLVHPGQTKEEQWFDNQMASSTRFQEFLESGVLGQKVTLKGFERFSAGLDTRLGEAGEYSYYDTWGEGFEIMYHVSTLLPHNNDDKQQIQRKRHIGNDIVCIVFVDGEQPFIPNAIKSQFLHIFVVIHLISLPDGTKGYAATIACDDQVPEFGPPLPDPPIFRTPQELRAFLLCKMINGENAAYKAPRLIKPHQRARSGMLESLVAKANCLTKERDSDKKLARQQKAMAATTLGTPVQSTTTSPATSTPPFSQPSMSNIPVSDRYLCRSMTAPASSCAIANDEKQQQHLHGTLKTGSTPGLRSSPRNSLVTLGSETAASIFRARRRDSNAEGSLAGFRAKEKEQQVSEGDSPYSLSLCQQRDRIFEGPKYIETLVSPTTSLPLPIKTPKSAPALRTLSSQSDTPRYGEQFHASGQCDYMCYSHCSNCSYRQNAYNSKGRSKSELDLLLITIQEGFKETSPKKLAAATQGVRTVSSPSHSRAQTTPLLLGPLFTSDQKHQAQPLEAGAKIAALAIHAHTTNIVIMFNTNITIPSVIINVSTHVNA
ncbi:Rap/ran-GAP protein [Gamsiella multidivaricata]|nr:Rap/ran-GAP protein [Gamsiella multidivaricata]